MCINIITSPMLQQTTLSLFNAGPPPCALCAIFKAVKDRDELLLDGVTVGNVSVSSASVSTHLEIVLRCPLFTQQCI